MFLNFCDFSSHINNFFRIFNPVETSPLHPSGPYFSFFPFFFPAKTLKIIPFQIILSGIFGFFPTKSDYQFTYFCIHPYE